MATDEESVLLNEPTGVAVQTCAAALTRAGFQDVAANHGALLVTGKKRAFGQWTKSQITLVLREVDDGTQVTVIGQANPQSLGSLVASPAKDLVDSVVEELRKAGAPAPGAEPRVNRSGDPSKPAMHPLDPDGYSDEDREPGWYVDPKSPWKMVHWDGSGWSKQTKKTPRRTQDGWWKVRESG
jgi:hypothetical protein